MSEPGTKPGAEVLLLLGLKQGDIEPLQTRLVQTPAAGLQLAKLLPASALPKLAHATGVAPELPDAILTLPAATEELSALMATLIRSADVSRARLLAVQRYEILPGRDPVRLVFALRRLPRLSVEEFCDYWLHRHSDFGRRLLPPYSYHQLHTDREATDRHARATGIPAADYDGIVEVHFPHLDAFVAQLSRPEVAEGALADERNFIDHRRSVFWAYSEERVGHQS